MKSIISPGALLAALSAASSLTNALPSPDLASTLFPRQLTNTSSPSINSNNTADCTNCTNLGNFDNPIPVSASDPVVRTRNGTYAGLTISPIPASSTFSGFGTNTTQEAFLGIPYAEQPVDDLRFRRPKSLNETWDEVRSAKRYSEHCWGKGTDNDYNPPYVTYKLGERCLTLNVVRPANVSGGRGEGEGGLPVWVWVHGGAFNYGGSGDVRYNGSFIVDKSVELGQPIMFVSINYRTSLLGFPGGDEVKEAGIQNLGLYDQRLALHWIRENIDAFSGDKDKVTIVGESAGGASMIFHLAAYGGRDDALFRGAAVQSGYFATQLDTQQNVKSGNDQWNSLADYAGCGAAGGNGTIDCLRRVPLETIKKWAFEKSKANIMFKPLIDGDMVQQDLHEALEEGKFVKNVPVLLNNNLDEGISFGVRGLNTTDDIIRALNSSQSLPDNWLTDDSRGDIARIYPDNEDIYPPYQAGPGTLPPTKGTLGLNDRRSCAIFGDLNFVGPRRYTSELFARSSNASIYSSQFHQVPYRNLVSAGSQHFGEVSYVFRNPLDSANPLGPLEKDRKLADEMSSYWISFVASGDPNTAREEGKLERGQKAPQWPKYSEAERGSVKWVWNGLGGRSEVVKDDFRSKGIELMMALRGGSYDPSKFGGMRKRDEL